MKVIQVWSDNGKFWVKYSLPLTSPEYVVALPLQSITPSKKVPVVFYNEGFVPSAAADAEAALGRMLM